jgi:Superinfection immunity protein
MDTLIGLVVFVMAVLVAVGIYFLPTIVAASGQKRKTGAIFVLNLFLGWTFLGWVLALVWAVADERTTPRDLVFMPPAPSAAPGPAAATPSLVEPAPPTWKAMPAAGQRVRLLAAAIVRVDADSMSRSTGELRSGTDVLVIRTSDAWAWVTTDDGREGWIQL